MKRFPQLLLASTLALIACGASDSEPELKDPVEHGALLFAESSRYGAYGNDFSCTDCHETSRATPEARILPGAPLSGVLDRPAYWGGAEVDLLRAVNYCRTSFMAASTAWLATDAEAEAMYAFLASLSEGSADIIPFTVSSTVEDLPCAGNYGDRGASIYEKACANCHGALHSGAGRRGVSVPILPEHVLSEHAEHAPPQSREAFVQKVRHGRFFGEGGSMPPFSVAVLDDDSLSALLDFIGVGSPDYCP